MLSRRSHTLRCTALSTGTTWVDSRSHLRILRPRLESKVRGAVRLLDGLPDRPHGPSPPVRKSPIARVGKAPEARIIDQEARNRGKKERKSSDKWHHMSCLHDYSLLRSIRSRRLERLMHNVQHASTSSPLQAFACCGMPHLSSATRCKDVYRATIYVYSAQWIPGTGRMITFVLPT